MSSKKRSFADASKNPETITTTSSIRDRIISKYKVADLDKHDLQRLHSAIENFSYTLMINVLQNRQYAELESSADGKTQKDSKKISRTTPDELWKALATSPSLRRFAYQFLNFKLVPPEYMYLFSDFDQSLLSKSRLGDGDDASDDEEINPFFLDDSSQVSGHDQYSSS